VNRAFSANSLDVSLNPGALPQARGDYRAPLALKNSPKARHVLSGDDRIARFVFRDERLTKLIERSAFYFTTRSVH
jgi:hypothetical protein